MVMLSRDVTLLPVVTRCPTDITVHTGSLVNTNYVAIVTTTAAQTSGQWVEPVLNQIKSPRMMLKMFTTSLAAGDNGSLGYSLLSLHVYNVTSLVNICGHIAVCGVTMQWYV